MLACVALGLQLSQAHGAEISPASLVGTWRLSEATAEGGVFETEVRLEQSMRFVVVGTIQGKQVVHWNGTWEVKDHQLIWHYDGGSSAIAPPAKTDIDNIISVDAAKLVLDSRLSNKEHVYLRER
jgi:hypothetical protein